MAKRKKKKRGVSLENPFSNLGTGTVHGIWAILFFIGALFLVLAGIGYAGVVGDVSFATLHKILGWGYLILPLLFILIGTALIRGLEYDFGTSKVIGSLIFFFASLGIVEIMFSQGGIIGILIVTPLVSLFEIYVTIFVLWGLTIISFIVLLELDLTNASFPFLRRIFSKKEDDGYAINGNETEKGEGYDEEETEDSGEEGYDEETEDESIKPGPALSDKRKEAPSEEDLPFAPIHGGTYSIPPLSLLEKDKGKPDVGDIKANANIIRRTLQNFGITVEIDEVSIGPSVTRYALKPAEGVRLSKIIGLQNNLELALAAHPVRIEAPIPGRSLVGVEIPNTSKATIGLASLLGTPAFQNTDKPLLVALGKDITGQPHLANIAKMPHLLIAGATGSGKSVTIHSLITSLLFRNSPEMLRFIMIDPKRVELTLYNNIHHLLTPVITDAKKAILALKWAAKEMDRRYDILEAEKVRDISSYHKNILEPALKKTKSKESVGEEMPEAMPYIIIVIDELADIMQAYPRELESAIVRIAQMSRAVGIHLILSTQRPSVNVITGLIKANIPARIALQVSSQIDSRTILDTGGAEKLLGAGDMLYLSGEMSKPHRIQSAFISENELKKVTKYLVKNNDEEIPDEITISGDGVVEKNGIFDAQFEENNEEEDELYEEAKEIVVHAGKASTSYLQRKLRIGYARAARLMDILEEKGVIGPADGAKPREVLTGRSLDENEEYEEEEK